MATQRKDIPSEVEVAPPYKVLTLLMFTAFTDSEQRGYNAYIGDIWLYGLQRQKLGRKDG